MNKNTENQCFVMMPFGNPFDEYYLEIYKKAIEENDLKPVRADDLFRPSPIIRDIWEYINNSKVLLADITGLNPNVMYELGLAHAIAKPVILISDNIKNVPFDLRHLRILIYNTERPKWANKLKNSIERSIAEILENPNDAILSAFLNIKPETKKTDEISAELIEFKQLIRSQSTNETQEVKKKFTAEMFAEAIKTARHLYFESGWEINDIKSELIKNFGIGVHTADSIFHSSIN
jgi:hypothetical protein